MSKTAQFAWTCAAALAVFVVWLATDVSANAGIGLLYAVPVGLAAWWGGGRWGAAAVVGCGALYVIGAAIQPVPDFGIALIVRLVVFVGVAVLVTATRERLIGLEHSAEELEDIQAALTPSRLLDLPDVDAGPRSSPPTTASRATATSSPMARTTPPWRSSATWSVMVPTRPAWPPSSGRGSRPSSLAPAIPANS